MSTTADETAIRALVETLTDGWNRHDGTLYAQPFAPDADFTTIRGEYARGRDAIAKGHDYIFQTIYRGTRLSTTVERIRFLRPDVAAVDAELRLDREDGTPFAPGRALASLVATKNGDGWAIQVFHNMIPAG